MADITIIRPDDMPNTFGPYRHGTVKNGLFFMAGQIPVDPDNPEAPLPETIEEQTEMVFKNIWRIFKAAGYGPEHVMSARVFLKNLPRDIGGMNTVYEKQFISGREPVRTTIGVVALARDALIEIDLVAYKD